MKVLCVAEKPSIARSVAQILSSNSANMRNGKNKYCKNFDFQCDFRGQSDVQMTMTSVLGHLMAIDFTEPYNKWNACEPSFLFDCQILQRVPEDKLDVARNLEFEAKYAQHLIIWTDCDREGEHIGFEIVQACSRSNSRLQVWRAKFSVVQRREIFEAMRNLVRLDMRQVAAVDARQELDLRIGAAFTRFQTLLFQSKFEVDQDNKVLSYGSCQFPTLGFVVEQYWRRERFKTEPFWSIQATLSKDEIDTTFAWNRGNLFDELATNIKFDQCNESPVATVKYVDNRPTSKWRPLPLTTVELQKLGSIFLRMTSHKVMKVAEDLYNKGFISYPRTETDEFPQGFNLQPLIVEQKKDSRWSSFAELLLTGGQFQWPRKGKHNDHAHPPIHPVKAAPDLQGDERSIYELMTRRFLACCALDAKGFQTSVSIDINGETFRATGLQVVEKNYLEIYTYEKWATCPIGSYQVNERVQPKSIKLTKGKTTPPELLTEASLIATMDKNGIGTDATIAEHIKKIEDRKYVMRVRGKFVPSNLGLALVESYDKISFDQSLAKPHLRKSMEDDMNRIMAGQVDKRQVVTTAVNMYKEMFIKANNQQRVLEETLEHYLIGGDDDEDDDIGGSDNDDGDSNANSLPPSLQRSGQAGGPSRECVMCNCNEESSRKVVAKEGPNRGRYFLCCASRSCDFFLWAEGSTSQSNGGSGSASRGSRGRGASGVQGRGGRGSRGGGRARGRGRGRGRS